MNDVPEECSIKQHYEQILHAVAKFYGLKCKRNTTAKLITKCVMVNQQVTHRASAGCITSVSSYRKPLLIQ